MARGGLFHQINFARAPPVAAKHNVKMIEEEKNFLLFFCCPAFGDLTDGRKYRQGGA
jgi:hypothetical protein